MPTQTLNDLSVRFFPHWNDKHIYQTVGLINMIDHILTKNPNAHNWLEIGSYIGESATLFLAFEKIKHLQCVDHSEIRISFLTEKFKEEIKRSRCSLYLGKSIDFVKSISDSSVDVIYIDADHSYESVSAEISVCWPKLKNNGFLCGHDYHEVVWPGVVRAVNEFANVHNNLHIQVFKDCSWLIHKV
jgi:predicted O-methyltransferase YrrM